MTCCFNIISSYFLKSKTDILVGVKVEIGEPRQLRPEQGYIEFFVDW